MVGIGMTIVGMMMVVGGGGGGSVGGGAEVLVAGTDVFVRGMDVFVRGTEVRVGLTDVGANVEMPVAVAPGWWVRDVAVGRKVAVGVGVRVEVGVGVGIVEVMVGISDGVCVGTVEVGNGPSRASDVSASAVLVLAALPNAPASMSGPRKASQIQRIAAIKLASSPMVRRLDRVPVKFNSWFPSSGRAMDTSSVGRASGSVWVCWWRVDAGYW